MFECDPILPAFRIITVSNRTHIEFGGFYCFYLPTLNVDIAIESLEQLFSLFSVRFFPKITEVLHKFPHAPEVDPLRVEASQRVEFILELFAPLLILIL